MEAWAALLSRVPAVTLHRSLLVFFSLRDNFEKFMQIRNFGELLGTPRAVEEGALEGQFAPGPQGLRGLIIEYL